MTRRERARKKFEEEFKPAYDAWIVYYPFTLEDLPGERWLPVPEFEELYHASNFGRVKRFYKNGNVKILKPSIFTNGYLRFQLCKSSKHKNFSAHRLVAQLFIPNPENLPEVDHVYGMKFDCSIWNLRWATSSENEKNAVEMGLIKSGEDNYRAVLTNAQVLYIRENPDKLTAVDLAKMFKTTPNSIRRIQRGERYKNVGGPIRKPHKSPTRF